MESMRILKLAPSEVLLVEAVKYAFKLSQLRTGRLRLARRRQGSKPHLESVVGSFSTSDIDLALDELLGELPADVRLHVEMSGVVYHDFHGVNVHVTSKECGGRRSERRITLHIRPLISFTVEGSSYTKVANGKTVPFMPRRQLLHRIRCSNTKEEEEEEEEEEEAAPPTTSPPPPPAADDHDREEAPEFVGSSYTGVDATMLLPSSAADVIAAFVLERLFDDAG